MEGKGDDKFFWAGSQRGDFSIKSACMVVTENEVGRTLLGNGRDRLVCGPLYGLHSMID